jgi:hypothetical protein
MKWCVVPSLSGGPDQEYILGTYPGAEAECVNNGGHVVEHNGDGCGTTTSAAAGTTPEAPSASPLAAAVVAPIRTLRAQLPESEVLRDLEAVNYSPDLLRILESDEAVRERLRDAVGMVSQLALLTLVDPEAETLRQSHYTEDLHGWLVELADMVRERTEDDELRSAIDRLVDAFEQRVGEPIGVMAQAMRRNGPGAGGSGPSAG